jgi:hypothetical protein
VYLEARGRLHQPADRPGGGTSGKRGASVFPELLAQRDIDAAGRRRRMRFQTGYRTLAGLARRHALLFQVIATVAAVLVLVLTFY